MNILISTIGRRGYMADYFREAGAAKVIGTSDRHSSDSEFTVGLLSCDRQIIVPPINSDEYIPALLKVCSDEKVDIIFSMYDDDCAVLSSYLENFKNMGLTAFLPDKRASDFCIDKLKTHEFFRANGFGSPDTFSSIEMFLESGLKFPAIIKPRRGFASIDIFKAKNERQLAALFDSESHIIQQVLNGKEYSFDILNNLEGKVVSAVVKRKIRMRAGETDQAVTVKDKSLLDLAVEIGEALAYPGPIDVDLFATDQGVKLLECNPRFGGGYPLSHAAGARFPELMLKMASGLSVKSILGNYREDLVMMKDVRVTTKPLAQLIAQAEPSYERATE